MNCGYGLVRFEPTDASYTDPDPARGLAWSLFPGILQLQPCGL